MSITLIEGFDHEVSTTPTAYVANNALPSGLTIKGWHVFDATPLGQRNLNMNTGRGGGGAFVINQEASIVGGITYVYKIIGGLTTLTVGFAFNVSATEGIGTGFPAQMPLSETPIFQIGVGTTSVVQVTCDNVGAVNATGCTAGPPILQLDVWHYIEVAVTIAGGSSTIEIDIDGANYLGPTTTGLGSSAITTVGPCTDNPGAAGTYFLYDDIYVNDAGGFLGDTMVQTVYPAADGTHLDWTPNTGTDHWSRVDEAPPDGDTSFVSANTPGDKDSYTILPISTLVAVYAAQLNLTAKKHDGGLREIAPLVRQSSTDYDGPTFALATSYVTYSWLLADDPTATPWTPAQINADQYGVDLIT